MIKILFSDHYDHFSPIKLSLNLPTVNLQQPHKQQSYETPKSK